MGTPRESGTLRAMNTQLEPTRSRPPVLRRAAAGAVLILAVVIAIKIVVGLVTAAFWTIVTIAVVVAVLWAIKELVW
jgi:hypothetical protein